MNKLSINNQDLLLYESIVLQVQKSLLLCIVLYVCSYKDFLPKEYLQSLEYHRVSASLMICRALASFPVSITKGNGVSPSL